MRDRRPLPTSERPCSVPAETPMRVFIPAAACPYGHESPWPWGQVVIHPDGTVDFDDSRIGEEEARRVVADWLAMRTPSGAHTGS